VPERVVDVLEAVYVEKQHGHLRAPPVGERNGVVQPIMQQHAIRQVGEGVVLREVQHPV